MARPKYSLRDSCFFRLKAKSKLASILQISYDKLIKLAALEGGYVQFQKPKKSGGMRDISAPIPPLKAVQARIAKLLARVAPPDYLFAPVAGRSYVDNAARHIGARSVRLLDIEDFFPSCTFKKVYWFFNKRMECSPDVATILARLVTENGVLPQGSPCSPILAYFAYIDMWEEIEDCVRRGNCKLSVYADDLTISGETVPESMAWAIKSILHRHGHKYKAEKEKARVNRAAEITGVILTKNGVVPPNRQRQRIHKVRSDLKAASSLKMQETLSAQLRGRLSQIKQIQAGNKLPSE